MNELPSLRYTPLNAGLTPACDAAIETAFGEVQEGRRLDHLRTRLMAGVELCPVCGFGEPKQLDHFLPKSEYELLAIYARNLVPLCGPCNNAKRALDPADGPQFVHPYFSVLPDADFLVANVQSNGAALTVDFAVNAVWLDPQLADALTFQLGRLKLNERYPKQINTFLFSQKTGLDGLLELGNPQEMQKYFERAANGLSRDFGRNDWRAALMRGLARSAAFCAVGVFAYFAQPRVVGA